MIIGRASIVGLLVSTLSMGCSAVLKFDECKVDADCASKIVPGGPALYCTADRLCVDRVPSERLCTREVGSIGSPDAIVIGALARITTDPPLELDLAMVQAVELAVEEIRQLRPIIAVICDSGSTSEQAARAIEVAVKEHGAVGIVGPTTSGITIPVAPTAIAQDVLLISPSATSPAITDLADGGLVWRTGASDLLQAKVLAEEIDVTTDVLDTFYANTA